MLAPLTETQRRIVDYLEARAESGTPPPTHRELCKRFRWSSTGSARDHLRAIERKGWIAVSHGRARSIRVAASQRKSGGRAVPVLGNIVAGTPIEAEERFEREFVFLPPDWISSGSHFALRVEGDSMSGASILDGDCVVIQRQDALKPGEIVAVTIRGETTLKRLRRSARGLVLAPENPRYNEIPVDDSLVIHGRAVAVLRKL